MKKLLAALSLTFLVPAIAFAQTLQPIGVLLVSIGHLANLAIPILVALTVVVFFYGLLMFVWHHGEEHKALMFWGLVALFIMLSLWGIIHLAQDALLTGGNATPINPPQVPTVQ
jgi:hypothetical protein